MLTKRTVFSIFSVVVLLLIVACAPVVLPASAESQEMVTLEFDIAEDMHRFVFDETKVYDDGLPADGSSFITRGYIYPAGTLTDSNGTNPDGTPEFPELVLGEWVCQGVMINDAGHATEGVWVFSNQFIQIGDEAGAQTITTMGYELADVGVAIARAITGGTGDYANARGQAEQTLLGLNASEGVNIRVKLDVNVAN